jgi:hypothetical protein
MGSIDLTLDAICTRTLQQMMESAGIEPVALYPLTPRSSDLTPLAVMEQAGFKPRATALILNEGEPIARGIGSRNSRKSEGIRPIRQPSRGARSRFGCHVSMPQRQLKTGGSASGRR